jgi:FMN phosphatase YigB (HAD superfamily)
VFIVVGTGRPPLTSETPIYTQHKTSGGLTKIPHKNKLNSDNVELLLIDMDGTLGFSLIPEDRAIHSALKWISEEVTRLSRHQVSEEEIEQLYMQIKTKQYKQYPLQTRRHDKRFRFTLLLDELSRDRHVEFPAKMIDKIMAIYWEVFQANAAPYPETHSTLEALKQRHKVVLITNNGKYEGEKKRKIFGLKPSKHYDLFITSEELGGTCKPSQEYFKRVMQQIRSSLGIDVPVNRIAIIGDDPSGDIALANMCGVMSVRVRKDLHSSEQPKSDLEKASAEIDEINELLKLL